MTTRKGSLLGVEPFPLSLGVEGLALVLCPGFTNPTRAGWHLGPNCLGSVLGPMSVPDDSQISSGIANHKSQFPSGIMLTWNPDNSTLQLVFLLLKENIFGRRLVSHPSNSLVFVFWSLLHPMNHLLSEHFPLYVCIYYLDDIKILEAVLIWLCRLN
jgi:hypothetical protein